MSNYIKREDAINAVMGEPTDAHYPSWYGEKLKALPAAPVREVARGKWITSDLDVKCVTCSNCKKLKLANRHAFTPLAFYEWGLNFCPNCGADMREIVPDIDVGRKGEGGPT